jgi:biofilm PGA synthesis protein PgaA
MAQPAADLLADTRTARDSRDFARAEALARAGLMQSDDPVWPLTLALVLGDQGRTADALAVLNAPRARPLPAKERLLAEAHAEANGGDRWAAMRAWGEVLRLDPGNGEAKAGLADSLDRLRAPHGAAALAGLPTFRAADQAAALTRWGAAVRPLEIAQRFNGTDRALAALDRLLAELRADAAADPALVRRVRLDRLVALRDRVLMAEALAEAEALAADAPLPLFATQARADALLWLRRPREALPLYETVLAADPGNLPATYSRFFALLESEDIDGAFAAIDALVATRQPFVAYRDGPAVNPDPEYAWASMTAAQARLWGNRVHEGVKRLDPLVTGAPANAAFRQARAGAYSARGWPRAAEREAAIAANMDPDGLGSRILRAETALARNRIAEAKGESDALLQLAPENQGVRRLSREVAAARGWFLEARFQPGFNGGAGTFLEGDGYTFGATLISPVNRQGLRLYGGFDSAEASPPEGDVSRHRAGGGVQIVRPDWSGVVYAATSWGSLPQDSFGFRLAVDLGDQWRIAADGEANSLQVPIRALIADISGDSLAGSIRFRRDERFEASARIDWLTLSDGNDRLALGFSAVQLLMNRPHLDIIGRADLSASRNSRPGGPYFAPEQDFTAAAGIRAQHVAWRRYHQVFTHAASVDGGLYQQKGFGNYWIGVLRYEHRWRHDPWTEIVYGASVDRRVFDGEAERGFSLFLGLSQRIG